MTERRETFVDQLAAASKEARQVLGELRSEMREGRRFLREVDTKLEEVNAAVRLAAREEISEQLTSELDALSDKVNDFARRCTDTIMKRFDEVYMRLMTGRARGEPKGPKAIDFRLPAHRAEPPSAEARRSKGTT